MLWLIRGGIVAGSEEEPVTISAGSDSPEMTPALARVFVGIFQRLLAEENAGVRTAKEGTAA
ncbi:MAG: hypothetical protein M0020_10615 [Actinomycetota bacterium]|nr:hypothetical protein [Actinomycetota bacterium]